MPNTIFGGASAQGLNFRQLYVGGARATRARTPNKASESDMGPYLLLNDWDNSARTLSVPSSDVKSSWRGLTSTIEMVIKNHFDDSRFFIAGVSPSNGLTTVVPQEPQRTMAFGSATSTYHFPNQSYFFENSCDFLDAHGEWFLDRNANIVYYIPRSGENMAKMSVVAPVTERLLDIHAGARNLSFEQLTFQYAGWIMPANRTIGLQSGLLFDGTPGLGGWNSVPMPGGIHISDATNITLSNCTVNHMGAVGVQMSHTTNHVVVDRCHVHDISGVGIWDGADLTPHTRNDPRRCFNVVISNCSVYDVGRDYTGAAGIASCFSDSLKILHNEIYNSPYVGITVGQGSTRDATSLQNNIISYNNIHDVMQLHDDNAGIYTQSLQPGTQITYNWVHNIKRSGWAEGNQVADIYLDNNSSQIIVAHNALDGHVGGKRIHTQVDAHDNRFFDNDNFDAETIALTGPPTGTFPAPAHIGLSTGGPHAGSLGDTLQVGCFLRAGQYLDGGGKFFCLMRSDGNLSIYKGSDPRHRQEMVWNTGLSNHPSGNYYATVSYLGFLQIFSGTPEKPGKIIWQNTPYVAPPSSPGCYMVHLQGDGNMVLMGGYGYNDNQGKPNIGYWDRVNGPPGKTF